MSEPVEGERLSKRVAALKGCSRSEAERYIEGGWVTVNEQVIETPQHRVGNESVLIDPNASALPQPPVTVLWHKPAGPACRLRQPPEAQWLADPQRVDSSRSAPRLLKKQWHDLWCATPLEAAASGLVVFSQSVPVQRKLLEDGGQLENEWLVDVAGGVPATVLERLKQLVRASVNRQTETLTRLRIARKGHRDGDIAGLLVQAGLTPDTCLRQRIGRVALSGLAPGQWRLLTAHERF